MKEKYGGNWAWLGWLFAFFGFVASFGIGNLAQANSVATALESTINIPTYITSIVLAIAVGLVVIGGIKSIARVTSKVVPVMAAVYFIGSFIALIGFHEHIGTAFLLIFDNAFTDKAVGGGLLGTVIRFGVARGLFSNEAGLGSAPIAHAASKVKDPVTQGIIGSLGLFIDTLVICTLTALVILVSGLVNFESTDVMNITDGLSGAPLTSEAFSITLGSYGSFIVSFCLIFFSFSTILGWSYYGSKCFEYFAGVKMVKVYLWFFTIITFFGCTWSISLVWNISDAFNGLMALPNLVALIALSPVVFTMLKKYEEKHKK